MSDPGRAMEDYRCSHQRKGGDYDATLSASPLDAYMDRWEAHHLEQWLPGLFPGGIPRYLDFACGTGRIVQRVEAHAGDACGVDVSDSMLNMARGKCRTARFVCADLTRGDAEPGPFDLVTAFRFFGNAQDELREAALAAINLRLRPGGYLILNNHRNPSSLLARRMAAVAEEMDLSHAKLGSLLRRHGFEIARQCAIGCWIFRFRLATARVLESAHAGVLERMFQHPWFVPWAPDALVAARKTSSAST